MPRSKWESGISSLAQPVLLPSFLAQRVLTSPLLRRAVAASERSRLWFRRPATELLTQDLPLLSGAHSHAPPHPASSARVPGSLASWASQTGHLPSFCTHPTLPARGPIKGLLQLLQRAAARRCVPPRACKHPSEPWLPWLQPAVRCCRAVLPRARARGAASRPRLERPRNAGVRPPPRRVRRTGTPVAPMLFSALTPASACRLFACPCWRWRWGRREGCLRRHRCLSPALPSPRRVASRWNVRWS